MKQLIFGRLAYIIMLAAFTLISCSSDDDETFDVSNLGGTWERIWDSGVMDAETARYTFIPESSTTGRIELYVKGWPDIDESKDLNYVIGHTGHINIFTGKIHDGESTVFGEYDIHKLSNSEMTWYRTDSNEQLARFKRVR